MHFITIPEEQAKKGGGKGQKSQTSYTSAKCASTKCAENHHKQLCKYLYEIIYCTH